MICRTRLIFIYTIAILNLINHRILAKNNPNSEGTSLTKGPTNFIIILAEPDRKFSYDRYKSSENGLDVLNFDTHGYVKICRKNTYQNIENLKGAYRLARLKYNCEDILEKNIMAILNMAQKRDMTTAIITARDTNLDEESIFENFYPKHQAFHKDKSKMKKLKHKKPKPKLQEEKSDENSEEKSEDNKSEAKSFENSDDNLIDKSLVKSIDTPEAEPKNQNEKGPNIYFKSVHTETEFCKSFDGNPKNKFKNSQKCRHKHKKHKFDTHNIYHGNNKYPPKVEIMSRPEKVPDIEKSNESSLVKLKQFGKEHNFSIINDNDYAKGFLNPQKFVKNKKYFGQLPLQADPKERYSNLPRLRYESNEKNYPPLIYADNPRLVEDYVDYDLLPKSNQTTEADNLDEYNIHQEKLESDNDYNVHQEIFLPMEQNSKNKNKRSIMENYENSHDGNVEIFEMKLEQDGKSKNFFEKLIEEFKNAYSKSLFNPKKRELNLNDFLDLQLFKEMQKLSYFPVVSKTIQKFENQKTEFDDKNGYLIIVKAGFLSELGNMNSELIQTIKHATENTNPDETLLVVTGRCPKKYRRNIKMPYFVKGVGSALFFDVKTLVDIFEKVRISLIGNRNRRKKRFIDENPYISYNKNLKFDRKQTSYDQKSKNYDPSQSPITPEFYNSNFKIFLDDLLSGKIQKIRSYYLKTRKSPEERMILLNEDYNVYSKSPKQFFSIYLNILYILSFIFIHFHF